MNAAVVLFMVSLKKFQFVFFSILEKIILCFHLHNSIKSKMQTI